MNLTWEEQERLIKYFMRIAVAFETIASAVKDGVVQMKDVDRAKVYSEHLGEKLKTGAAMVRTALTQESPSKNRGIIDVDPTVTEEDVRSQQGRG